MLWIPLVILLVLLFSGCAATRYVPQGKHLLRKNVVHVEKEKEKERKDVSPSVLEPYLRQKPNTTIIFGWKAFLNLYSMSPNTDNGLSRFLRKMGEPPVIFDPVLIEYSKQNIDII